jgi:hypothetical protein
MFLKKMRLYVCRATLVASTALPLACGKYNQGVSDKEEAQKKASEAGLVLTNKVLRQQYLQDALNQAEVRDNILRISKVEGFTCEDFGLDEPTDEQSATYPKEFFCLKTFTWND